MSNSTKHKFVPYENGWNLNCQICKFGECDERHSSPTDSADKVDFEKRDQEEMARIIERLHVHQNSTKLPWDFDAEDLSIYQLETLEPITGALCEVENPHTRANAEFIVTACNNYEALRDVVKIMQDAMNDKAHAWNRARKWLDEHDVYHGDLQENAVLAEVCKVALANAKALEGL